MPNFGYHLARAEGRALRSLYHLALGTGILPRVPHKRTFPFEVFSYSGETALPEQVSSIRSFLRYVGHPPKFTVVSDGSYRARSIGLLHAIDPVVAVAPFTQWIPSAVPEELHSYLTTHQTGKQLALIMSLPKNGPALYLDSDVRFFPGASDLAEHLTSNPATYLADCKLSGDERLFREPAEKANPVNTGVVFLAQKLDWSLGIERFLQLHGLPDFFTNQTVTHLVLHANAARPFDPDRFVLQLDDQFIYRDRYASPALVLRHYVNPVRHKFWTSLWR